MAVLPYGSSFTVGDYTYTVIDTVTTPPKVSAKVADKTKTSYATLPGRATYQGTTYRVDSLYRCFKDCANMVSAPQITPSGSIRSLSSCFEGCTSLSEPPVLPSDTDNLTRAFYGCTSLRTPPVIPEYASTFVQCFYGCTALTSAPSFPAGAADLEQCFYGCTALVTPPASLGKGIVLTETFKNCSSLTSAPAIPSTTNTMAGCFEGCTSLSGEIQIGPAGSADFNKRISKAFYGTEKGIWLTGNSLSLEKLAATANNGNVFIGLIPLDYSFTAERVDTSGATSPSAEGLWAYLQLDITWADFAANNIDAITLTDNSDPALITWYTDQERTAPILLPDWHPSSSVTIYGWAPLDTGTHLLELTIADEYNTGNIIGITVPQVFRTFDFLRGGKGIAFGKVAENEGFECAMKSTFEDDFILKNNSFERDAGGTLNEGISFVDANDDRIAYMKALSELDSQDRTIEGFNIGTSRAVGSSTIWNTLRLMIDADGNPVVTIGQPAAWRKALGIPLIDNGLADPGSVAANSYGNVNVTFSKTFAEVPNVVVGFNSNSTAAAFGRCSCSVASVTKTGCVLRFFNGDTVARHPGIRWIAIGE